MGEAGFPEAIMPLKRGNDGKLGVSVGDSCNRGGSIGNIQIFLDGKEIGGNMKIIADGVVVERNRRNLSGTTRAYQ